MLMGKFEVSRCFNNKMRPVRKEEKWWLENVISVAVSNSWDDQQLCFQSLIKSLLCFIKIAVDIFHFPFSTVKKASMWARAMHGIHKRKKVAYARNYRKSFVTFQHTKWKKEKRGKWRFCFSLIVISFFIVQRVDREREKAR